MITLLVHLNYFYCFYSSFSPIQKEKILFPNSNPQISQNKKKESQNNSQFLQQKPQKPEKNPQSPSPNPMSIETHTPIHNDIRYEIKLKYHKENSFVVYEMIVHDLAFGKEEMLVFRFSEIKKFHQALLNNESLKGKKEGVPPFPKRNSFGFWNRTNTCPRKIDDRKRQLEFYFTKLLNDPFLRGLREVKTLLNHVVKERRRTRSMSFINNLQEQKRETKIHSLPKKTLYSFPRSEKDQIFNYS